VPGDDVDIFYFKFYDDISMLFHSLTFVILCGSEFSSILQNSAHVFLKTFLFKFLSQSISGCYGPSS
jgi:hypothetical protein